MSNLREIKDRIGSVKKTKKITQAMKMVAASKFKRAQERLSKAKEYGAALETIFSELSSRMEPDGLPTTLKGNDGTRQAVIVVTGDRGLCGGFNTSILKKAHRYLQDQNAASVDLYLIGNKSVQFFKNKPYAISEQYTHMMETVSESSISAILNPVIKKYEGAEYGRVVLFYNEFISAMSNMQIEEQILPLTLKDWSPTEHTNASDYFYEPGKGAVLSHYISKFVTYKVYQALLESNTSEEGSRMVAMDTATDNAGEVIYDLTLQFNRSRQTAITTELTEIVAGAASLG